MIIAQLTVHSPLFFKIVITGRKKRSIMESEDTRPPSASGNTLVGDEGKSVDFRSLAKRPWRLRVTPGHEILAAHYDGEGTDAKPYVVDWLDSDAENPMTWSATYKWSVTMSVAVATLAVAMASSTLQVQTFVLARLHQYQAHNLDPPRPFRSKRHSAYTRLKSTSWSPLALSSALSSDPCCGHQCRKCTAVESSSYLPTSSLPSSTAVSLPAKTYGH